MFTGIVEFQGLICARVVSDNDLSLVVEAAEFDQASVNVGDSISVIRCFKITFNRFSLPVGCFVVKIIHV